MACRTGEKGPILLQRLRPVYNTASETLAAEQSSCMGNPRKPKSSGEFVMMRISENMPAKTEVAISIMVRSRIRKSALLTPPILRAAPPASSTAQAEGASAAPGQCSTRDFLVFRGLISLDVVFSVAGEAPMWYLRALGTDVQEVALCGPLKSI